MSLIEKMAIGACIGSLIGWGVAYIQHIRRKNKLTRELFQLLDDIYQLIKKGKK